MPINNELTQAVVNIDGIQAIGDQHSGTSDFVVILDGASFDTLIELRDVLPATHKLDDLTVTTEHKIAVEGHKQEVL